MTWCAGDTRVATVSVCEFDTFEGVVVLLSAGLLTALCLLHLRSSLKSGGRKAHGPATAAYAAAVAALLSSHVAILTSLAVAGHQHDAPAAWTLMPARLFLHSAALALYALLALLILIGWCQRIPVPYTRPVATCVAAFYVSRVALDVPQNSAGHLPAALLVASCLQCLASLALAILAAVTARSGEAEGGVAAPLLGDLEAPARSGAKQVPESTWYAALGRAVQYVWPKQFGLQVRAVACVVLVLIIRFLNIAVPVCYGRMVDALYAVQDAARREPPAIRPSFSAAFFPWIAAYLGFRFLQGGGGVGSVGVIANARSFLWIPISQDAERRISLQAFEHMLYLDLSFHLERKTGELIRVIDRGTSSIRVLLESILFSIGPAMIDVVIAVTYLSSKEAWMSGIVLVSVLFYVPITVVITELRGKLRRTMNTLDNRKSAKVTDALLNYETVKYFTNERMEVANYRAAICEYQASEMTLLVSLNGLNLVQGLVMFSGVAAGMAVCAAKVASGELTVGDAVLFLSLMSQIYAPLNYFGSYYRQIQRYMIDMENMFELLGRRGSVRDAPRAPPLRLAAGALEFRNVWFAYKPERMILKDVTLSIPGGSSVAFVGATGAGKSTILRLIFRFYDPASGSILLDGQDLRSVTQASLRGHVGVVPQDTVLFNDTIRYNIAYGRPSATDEEVEAACAAAMLHDSIMARFPEQYDTVVGERGLRLSGGEKQRVAFARAILKNPALLVLDEATSSLDSITEHDIQQCLRGLKSQRTTVTVAHRLSTVMEADTIVVLDHGEVKEAGSHQALIASGGLYAKLWQRQLTSPSVDDLAGRGGATAHAEVASPATGSPHE